MVPVLRPSSSALMELLLSLGGAGDRGSSPSPGKREMSPVMQQGRSGEAQAALMEQNPPGSRSHPCGMWQPLGAASRDLSGVNHGQRS